MDNLISVSFRPVLNYSGLYEVDDKGNVWKLCTDGTLTKIKPRCVGAKMEYRAVCLTKNHITKQYLIDTLVCESFKGLPRENPDGTAFRTMPEVYHLNGKLQDNTADNLVWADRFFIEMESLEDAEQNKK